MILCVISEEVHILITLKLYDSRSSRYMDSLLLSVATLTIIVKSYAVACG